MQNTLQQITNTFMIRPAPGCGPDDAERLAAEVLAAGGWHAHEHPIPAKTAAESLGFRCFVQDGIPGRHMGAVYAGGTTRKVYGHDRVIAADRSLSFPRQRLIIAWGLGHYLTGYAGSALEQTPRKLFARFYEWERRACSDAEEAFAQRFASALLMPADAFTAQYAWLMKAVGCDRNFAIPALAAYFGVPETAVLQRLIETGMGWELSILPQG